MFDTFFTLSLSSVSVSVSLSLSLCLCLFLCLCLCLSPSSLSSLSSLSLLSLPPLALAGKTYISLRDNSSISFQPSVLRPLLSMCSTLMGLSVTPIPYLVAQKVYDDLKSLLRGRVTSTDHLNLIKTLMNYQRYTK